MANSSTNIDTISSTQASKEVTANAFFDASSQAATYGRRASTSSGLTWGFYGGNVCLANGTRALVNNGTLTLSASMTQYIVAAKSTGTVSSSSATTNWDDQANYWRLYSVVTNATSVTSWTDYRLAAQFTGAESPILAPNAPASATAAGVAGEIGWDGSFIYLCVATNTWVRAAVLTW
jgi:hypothetical protein